MRDLIKEMSFFKSFIYIKDQIFTLVDPIITTRVTLFCLLPKIYKPVLLTDSLYYGAFRQLLIYFLMQILFQPLSNNYCPIAKMHLQLRHI